MPSSRIEGFDRSASDENVEALLCLTVPHGLRCDTNLPPSSNPGLESGLSLELTRDGGQRFHAAGQFFQGRGQPFSF